MSACPNGWLAWELQPPGFPPQSAYYFAPSTPGGYQVVVQGEITDQSGQKVEYQGNASATITVSAQ